MSIDVEVDLTQGIYVLIAKVGADGLPFPGPYVDPDGNVVRVHAGAALERMGEKKLAARVRRLLADWPHPQLEQGDWAALGDLCLQVWKSVHERNPF